ncbi:Urea ABC transporter, permease protein UrtC [hydrothermal vent metagenome]|uniref:Urea ABC transporter, permease protein UrtC n=1 Tax=hydrothermal vent metagenome TaxID=652676 RepID=A0A3B0ZE84_9ZZZZ
MVDEKKVYQSKVMLLLKSDKGGSILIAFLLALAVVVPVCNLMVPESSSWHMPTYIVVLLGKYLCFALLALALDLVWGYCGILSLGHAAFFALGGYAMGMYLMRQIGDRGVYGNPDLPDFMVFLDWQELPWYWSGFDQFWFAMLMAVLVPGLLAYVFGWLAFRSRVTGVYLSIMTQALTYALLLAFFRNEMGFGGNNGLTDFKDILGFSLQQDTTRVMLFLASVVSLVCAYLACRYIVRSKMGRVVVAVRDAENRARFLGYRVEHYKLWIFTFSAMLAGIAGALYVPQVGIINPGEFSPLNSIELVVWVALGGRGTLYGAIVGAIVVNYAKTYFTGAFPEVWLFALGGLFVLVTLLLPRGIVGLIEKYNARLKKKNNNSLPDEHNQEVQREKA